MLEEGTKLGGGDHEFSFRLRKFETSTHRHGADRYINLELKGEATTEDRKLGRHQLIAVN